MDKRLSLIRATLLVVGLVQPAGVVPSPPNEPAVVEMAGDVITIRCHGGTLFDGRIKNRDVLARATVNAFRTGTAVEQVVALTARSGRVPLELAGTVSGSDQAFAAESDRPLRGLPIVRHSSGPSRSLRNHAVYDRQWDWVLSVDDHPRTAVHVVPLMEASGRRTFSLEAKGGEILLRFRPRCDSRTDQAGLEPGDPRRVTLSSGPGRFEPGIATL